MDPQVGVGEDRPQLGTLSLGVAGLESGAPSTRRNLLVEIRALFNKVFNHEPDRRPSTVPPGPAPSYSVLTSSRRSFGTYPVSGPRTESERHFVEGIDTVRPLVWLTFPTRLPSKLVIHVSSTFSQSGCLPEPTYSVTEVWRSRDVGTDDSGTQDEPCSGQVVLGPPCLGSSLLDPVGSATLCAREGVTVARGTDDSRRVGEGLPTRSGGGYRPSTLVEKSPRRRGDL